VLSVLRHSSHNSESLTVREYVMSCEDVSELGDRPSRSRRVSKHVGRPDSPAANLSRQAPVPFGVASICWLQAVDGRVPQMNRSRFIAGHEQMDEEGSVRDRRCSLLAQSPKHPDGNDLARMSSSALPCALLARLPAAAEEAAVAAPHAGTARTLHSLTMGIPRHLLG
jgi:hypothetical protein